MGISASKVIDILWNHTDVDWAVVGLENAGKSTIIQKMKFGDIVSSTPISGFHLETLTYKRITFKIWDLGGSDEVRNHYKQYLKSAQAIIFVVDSNDRIDEARNELQKIMNDNDFRDAILLVYANKQDLPNAMSASKITKELGLQSLNTEHWFIQTCCAISGDGLEEGFEWTASTVRKYRGV